MVTMMMASEGGLYPEKSAYHVTAAENRRAIYSRAWSAHWVKVSHHPRGWSALAPEFEETSVIEKRTESNAAANADGRKKHPYRKSRDEGGFDEFLGSLNQRSVKPKGKGLEYKYTAPWGGGAAAIKYMDKLYYNICSASWVLSCKIAHILEWDNRLFNRVCSFAASSHKWEIYEKIVVHLRTTGFTANDPAKCHRYLKRLTYCAKLGH